MFLRTLLLPGFLLPISLVLASCTDLPLNVAPVSELLHKSDADQTTDYIIGVGDEVEIKFFSTPELNDRVIVRPDGKISLAMVQDIKAAGNTPKQLARLLRNRLADKVRQPELVVILRSLASQRAFVGGEVTKPGSVQLSGNETLLQVINMAGWMTPDASPEHIILMRRYSESDQKLYVLDYQKMASGENLALNVPIKAGDVVLVPPSDITSVNRWIDKNIRKVIPFSTTAGAYYNVNAATQ